MHSLRPPSVVDEPTLDDVASADLADFRAAHAYACEHANGAVEGLHGPDSVTWEMWREPMLLSAGLPAVLMQIAHPAIAEGVHAYSVFDKDLIGRTRRTFSSLYDFAFGSMHDVSLASKRLHAIHRRVSGRIDDVSVSAHGSAYRANDQQLLLWVGATLPFIARRVFEQTVRPLSANDLTRLHREWQITSAATGVLPENMATDAQAFDAWMDQTIAHGGIEVGRKARSIAQRLFNTAITRGPFDEALAAGLLPPALRDAYGLPWTRTHQRMYSGVIATLRAHVRLVPEPVRYVVAWHQANLRVARARGERASTYARVLNAIDRRIDLPTSLKPIGKRIIIKER